MSGTKERITISVDAAVKSDLETQVPKNRRSAFAEKALEDALERLAREKALAALDVLEPVPNPQNTRSEDLLRELRQGQGNDLLDSNSSR